MLPRLKKYVVGPCIMPTFDMKNTTDEKKKDLEAAIDDFQAVEFDCGRFDWSKNSTFKYVLIEVSSPVV